MSLPNEHVSVLRDFLSCADFHRGSVVLDLDGTALYEEQGKLFISGAVEAGIRDVLDHDIPVVVNTLRFPLSVIKAIGDQWLDQITPSMPSVLLNGSLIGSVERVDGKVSFTEKACFPLTLEELLDTARGIRQLVDARIMDIIFFYYPRDWKKGEIIWVPEASRIDSVWNKYVSASQVWAGSVDELATRLTAEDICMAYSTVDRPHDMLMAYQHKEPSSFFTRKGVDKSFGLKEMASLLSVSLEDSLGAGDTMMDRFLSEVGLAIIVGRSELSFKGIYHTLQVDAPAELGELLSFLAEMAEEKQTR